jgi:hypothetical protein
MVNGPDARRVNRKWRAGRILKPFKVTLKALRADVTSVWDLPTRPDVATI